MDISDGREDPPSAHPLDVNIILKLLFESWSGARTRSSTERRVFGPVERSGAASNRTDHYGRPRGQQTMCERVCVPVASAVESISARCKNADADMLMSRLMCRSDAAVSVSGFLMRLLDPSWPMVSVGRADARQACWVAMTHEAVGSRLRSDSGWTVLCSVTLRQNRDLSQV